MTAIKWVKALKDVRQGKEVSCPECGKSKIAVEFVEITKEDGTVVLSCPSCKKMVHFSHQKRI